MHLQTLQLTNFKNYQQQKLEFVAKLNLLAGKNGSGKTNLLDAIYYMCFCKSYFNSSDALNIRHEQHFFRLVGGFMVKGNCEEVVGKIGMGRRKEFLRNEVRYSKLSDHIGLFPLVMIAPDDIHLVKGDSQSRRKLLDSAISQLDSPYLKTLILYNKVLFQRNAWLKKFAEKGYFNPSLIATYTEQLIPLANRVHRRRKRFVEILLPVLQHFYEKISGGKEQVTCDYESALNDSDYAFILEKKIAQDRAAQRTTEGIHRDDIVFMINGYPLKKFGSQGQQKSFLIALKLAIYQILNDKKERTPILLLDDIFDKLDEERTMQLVHVVTGNDFGQVFISDTQLHRMRVIFETLALPFKAFEIDNGVVQIVAEMGVVEREAVVTD